MAFSKPSDFKSSGYFKPGDHTTSLALVFEPKSIQKNVPNEYNGQARVRDEVLADISVFDNQAAIDAGEPSDVLKAVKVTHGYITEKLERVLPDGAIPARIVKTPTKKGGAAWNLDDVAGDVQDALEKWYEAREAAVAAALADAPDFDED